MKSDPLTCLGIAFVFFCCGLAVGMAVERQQRWHVPTWDERLQRNIDMTREIMGLDMLLARLLEDSRTNAR